MLDALNYILERRCPSGGYCFYRLDEPNAQDTYFALNVLDLLCIEFQDAKTVKFLKQLQHPDGSYQSLDTCFYCFESLLLMGEEPIHPVNSFLDLAENELIKAYHTRNFSKETFLRHAYLYSLIKKRLKQCISQQIIKVIRKMDKSCLLLSEKFYITEILLNAGEKIERQQIEDFLREREDPIWGFKEAANVHLVYLEQQYMGMKLCERFEIEPLYPSTIEAFVLSCKKGNGGFSRSEMGIATLKYTYFALYVLNALKFHNREKSRLLNY